MQNDITYVIITVSFNGNRIFLQRSKRQIVNKKPGDDHLKDTDAVKELRGELMKFFNFQLNLQ